MQQSISLKVYLALDIIHVQHYLHYSWVETGEHTTDKKAQKFTAQLQCIRICYRQNRKSLRRTHEFNDRNKLSFIKPPPKVLSEIPH